MRFETHPEPGFEGWWAITDTTTDEMVATRPRPQLATQITTKLNAQYPEVAPAFDTLVHEIVGWRIQGVAG